jgi:MYXO-CTERM domain-containing protein
MKARTTLLALAALSVLPCVDSRADLTAGYVFDENSGNTAHDAIRGPGGDGALINFDGLQWVPGKIGGALELDGANDYVLALNVIPTGTTRFSISVWVWTDGSPVWASIAKNWGNTQPGSFHFGMDNLSGRISNYLGTPQDGPIIAPTVLSINTWHHLALTWDAPTRSEQLYIDGISVASRTTPVGLTALTALSPNMSFGAKTTNSTLVADGVVPGYWNGKFDDLAFFDHVLTAADVAQIKANGDAGISVVPEPGCAVLGLLGLASLSSRRRRSQAAVACGRNKG